MSGIRFVSPFSIFTHTHTRTHLYTDSPIHWYNITETKVISQKWMTEGRTWQTNELHTKRRKEKQFILCTSCVLAYRFDNSNSVSFRAHILGRTTLIPRSHQQNRPKYLLMQALDVAAFERKLKWIIIGELDFFHCPRHRWHRRHSCPPRHHPFSYFSLFYHSRPIFAVFAFSTIPFRSRIPISIFELSLPDIQIVFHLVFGIIK